MKSKVFSAIALAIMILMVIPVASLAAGINVSISQPADDAQLLLGESTTFEAQATGGDPTTYDYNWIWGDGTSINTENTTISKIYNSLGVKVVTLSVTDMDGNSGSASISVNVVESADVLAVSNIQVTNITTNSATITWTTNHPATSRVIYDVISRPTIDPEDKPNHGYAYSTQTSSELTTDHSVTLTGLSANTTYYFRVISTREI
ncbi:MAG TPA: hypothetical protein ENN31_00295 [Candidatus Vogelbacteria bacterium]|nr:hypothetical protein [Candidatus Vogelbacteria bacterium]